MTSDHFVIAAADEIDVEWAEVVADLDAFVARLKARPYRDVDLAISVEAVTRRYIEDDPMWKVYAAWAYSRDLQRQTEAMIPSETPGAVQ